MTNTPPWMWIFFLGIILFLMAFDLGVLHRKDKEISVSEGLWMSGFYILIACLFGLWIGYELGHQSAIQYLTGFLVEKSLALDNIFVIALIFKFFQIPLKYQHRVLFWGILGVIILRAIFIGLGAVLISKFSWILYLFAVFLMGTGIKMLVIVDHETDLKDNWLLKFLFRHLRVSSNFSGHHFFVKIKDFKTNQLKWWVTPLFVALCLIEAADLVFSVDSIPAIFAITTDPYLVYTSNIFAVLGLRALYFALAVIIVRFQYLKYALACVLIFIGSKIFIADWIGMEKFPASISLAITFGLLASGVLYSLYKTRTK